MAHKMTPWFPVDVNPVRNGHYRVERDVWGAWGFKRSVHLLWFLNGTWRYPMNARNCYAGSLARMDMRSRWRGLASNPAKD